MNFASLAHLIASLAPIAISVAETIHPIPGSGGKKLSTATGIVQSVLQALGTAKVIPSDVPVGVGQITDAINGAVAAANAVGGVPTLAAQQ